MILVYILHNSKGPQKFSKNLTTLISYSNKYCFPQFWFMVPPPILGPITKYECFFYEPSLSKIKVQL